MGELIEEVLSRARFHHSVEISCLELPLHFTFGLDPFCRDFASTDGLESESRLILAEEADWSTQSHHDDGIPSQQR